MKNLIISDQPFFSHVFITTKGRITNIPNDLLIKLNEVDGV